MIVLILEKVPESLRGQLTRWLLEIKAGVFVGNVSTLVREKLWELVRGELRAHSGAILIYRAPTEQGFQIDIHGKTSRQLHSLDGLQLIRRPHPNREKALAKLNASLGSFRARQRVEKLDLPDVEV